MKILFVCWGNVGRSQMAKAFYNTFTHSQDADSAGTAVQQPGETLQAQRDRIGGVYTIDAMAEEGVDVSQYVKTQLAQEMLDGYDKIICMAQPEYTPEWLADAPNFVRWDVDDPGGKGLKETIAARDIIKQKVNELLHKPSQVNQAARIIWDYMQMNQKLEKADVLFVLCSHDVRVAEYAVELYNEGLAEWMIFSGGSGALTKDLFEKPEAEVFADYAFESGIPTEKIIIEPRASNTGENIRFTYDLLKKENYDFRSFILVQKPYMERRTYATFMKQWPDSSSGIAVTSPRLDFDTYFNGGAIDKDFALNVMVGDLQRIREYPKLGFQIEQEIPDKVWEAYEFLVRAGYTEHLIKK